MHHTFLLLATAFAVAPNSTFYALDMSPSMISTFLFNRVLKESLLVVKICEVPRATVV